MESAWEEVINRLVTNSDRNNFLSLLSDLKRAAFKTTGGIKSVAHGNPFLSDQIISLIPDTFEKMEDRNEFEKMIEKIEEEVKSIKSIDLTLAIEPSPAILKTLSAFANENFKEKVVFNLILDPHTIGGAILVINGKYMDFSLLSKLNDAFSSKKEELVALLGKEYRFVN